MFEKITFGKAINEAIHQAMNLDKSVITIGQLVNYSPPGIFGTTTDLKKKFGSNRVFDFPVAESLMTSQAIGMALAGLKPILVHQRLDFALYSMDAIVNWMSLWKFKSAGLSNLPITIRVIVGKGWGQGPQHSKSLYSMFAHLPGIKVCVPSNPSDAKGMLLESVFSKSPTIFFENRALFGMEGQVQKDLFVTKFGKARKLFSGEKLTLVSFGNEIQIIKRALSKIKHKNMIDLIDLRSIKPIDNKTIINSVRKTKQLLVVEGDWKSFGVSAEIISLVNEKLSNKFKINSKRLCYRNSHTPSSSYLEEKFYISEKDIIQTIKKFLI